MKASAIGHFSHFFDEIPIKLLNSDTLRESWPTAQTPIGIITVNFETLKSKPYSTKITLVLNL